MRPAEIESGNLPMNMKAGLYAAFLYVANIPHGKKVTRRSIESALQRLKPSVTFKGIVGRPDSILLRCGGPATEDSDSVRRAVSESLDCACVVISTRTLERLVGAGLDSLVALGYPSTAPYRVISDGAEWELCLVLCSESLPPGADGQTWLFSPTRNAVALQGVGAPRPAGPEATAHRERRADYVGRDAD
jgi:hypothetical protein